MTVGSNWFLVARWHARDTRRSKGLWAVLGLFAALGIVAATLPAVVIADPLAADQALAFVSPPLKLVVTLTGLLAGYGAIAGPRADGRLCLVLGLPIDRTELVIGAFVGRAAIVSGGVVVGLAATGTAVWLAYGALPLRQLALVGGLLCLLGIAVTALAVGLSAACATPGRAAVAAIGAFVLFEFFWGIVPAGAHYAVEGSLPGSTVPAWVALLERLQPVAAFEAALDHALPRVEAGIRVSPGGAQAAPSPGANGLADRVAGSGPFYLTPWFAVATLVGWTVGPLAAGVARFRRSDL